MSKVAFYEAVCARIDGKQESSVEKRREMTNDEELTYLQERLQEHLERIRLLDEDYANERKSKTTTVKCSKCGEEFDYNE